MLRLKILRKFWFHHDRIHKINTSLSLSLPNRGESGFFHLQNTLGWAKRPLVERIGKELDPTVPISLIYGTHSWVQTLTEDELCELRPSSYIKVYDIPKAGHHVHAHQPELFNYTVNAILNIVDEGRDEVECS